MSRERSGSLEFCPKRREYFVRLTIDLPGGKTKRKRCWLKTSDEKRAERLRTDFVALNNAGKLHAEERATVARPETFGTYAEAWLKRREAQGVKMVKDERGYLKRDILPRLGHVGLVEVKPAHIRAVLDVAVARKLSRGSVGHIRRLMSRVFKTAWQEEQIHENPVARVPMPPMREVKRERMILADEEIATFLACPGVDAELKVLSLAARTEGGMRTGDLLAWDWSQIDTATFAQCTVPRSKTGLPQVLAIPSDLGVVLRAWHWALGSPVTGPVFPLPHGEGKGGLQEATRHVLRLTPAALPPPGRRPPPRLHPSRRRQAVEEGRGLLPLPRPGPALQRHDEHAPGRLPLLPPGVQHGPCRGRRQRPTGHAPRGALRCEDPHAVRDEHAGNGHDTHGRATAAQCQ